MVIYAIHKTDARHLHNLRKWRQNDCAETKHCLFFSQLHHFLVYKTTMHSSTSHKARPRTLEPRTTQVSVTSSPWTTTESRQTAGLESPSVRLWQRPSSLTTSSNRTTWDVPKKSARLLKDVHSSEAPYRAATIEFFAKPLSTVSWITLDEETRRRHLDNNDSLLAIGSCLGDNSDWIRLVRLHVAEHNTNEAITELSLHSVTTVPVGDVVNAFCPCSVAKSSNNVLLFYGTLRGQVYGVELPLDEDDRDIPMSCSKESWHCTQKESIVGLTELPFGNQLVAATNLVSCQRYYV